MVVHKKVLSTPKPTRKEILTLRLLIGLGLLALSQFVWWFFLPGHIGHPLLYGLLTFSLLFKLGRMLHEWYHYFSIQVPEHRGLTRHYSVDVLSTACPGEPIDMIATTLEAVQAITYPHTTYLCDEGDDPALKAICKRLGVIHVTRQEKIDAKAGNINNALQQATGEICVILDPDHIPVPQFLDRVLPYFEDEQIGYVQVVQAYYNQHESLVACGVAEQTYNFYGPMMMSMGHYGTAQAIGANCTFRRAALDSIGGHAPGLTEDMHTAMRLHAHGWKSVYVPEVLSHGLVPATMAAYYKQQVKWARGAFDLLFYVYPRLFSRFTWQQKLHYFTAPLYYLFGIVGIIDLFVPAASLVMGEYPWTVNLGQFLLRFLPLFALSLLIRQYAQRWLLEEHEKGFHILGGLLRVGTWWIYTLGFIYTIFRVNVPYIPTPKKDQPQNHVKLCLPNLIGAIVSLGVIVYASHHYGLLTKLWVDAVKLRDLPEFYSYATFMAGFACLNAFVLGFNVLLGQEKFLAAAYRFMQGNYPVKAWLQGLGKGVWQTQHTVYRLLAQHRFFMLLPLLGTTVFLVFSNDSFYPARQTRKESIQARLMKNPFMNGVYVSQASIKAFSQHSSGAGVKLDPSITLISLHQPGITDSLEPFPAGQIRFITRQGAYPLLTWNLRLAEGSPYNEPKPQSLVKAITEGRFDNYLRGYAAQIKAHSSPVFIRLLPGVVPAHAAATGPDRGSPDEFIGAWRYVVTFFRQQGVTNVRWVWSPSTDTDIKQYYPGSDYVDWIGVSCLNYGEASVDGEWHSFRALYEPFRSQIFWHKDSKIRTKPVIITELGSTSYGGDGTLWITDALGQLTDYPEIRSVVFYATDRDAHWPTAWRPSPTTQYISWDTKPLGERLVEFHQHPEDSLVNNRDVISSY
ncbi:hypothetical protein GCM10023187_20520 [Nibrella viscosa]|uniref:GH26 domain-containing protein n=1 Tax=Nibrella viscosa TaxID=1084524 RepID=A0ABP8KDP8_9BACT